jgi:uncharacterized membrane protein
MPEGGIGSLATRSRNSHPSRKTSKIGISASGQEYAWCRVRSTPPEVDLRRRPVKAQESVVRKRRTMMLRADASMMINRPVKEVWEFFLKSENVPKWALDLSEARYITEGPIGVGTKSYWTQTFLGIDMSSTQEIYEFEPYKVIAFKSISGPFPMTLRYTFNTRPEGTLVTAFLEAEPGGFFKLGEPLLNPIVTRHFKNSLENLKDLVEIEALVPA